MKRARKVSNVHGEVHFKQKQGLIIVFAGNTSPLPPLPPTESSSVKAQKISLLIKFMPSTCNSTITELPYDAPKKP